MRDVVAFTARLFEFAEPSMRASIAVGMIDTTMSMPIRPLLVQLLDTSFQVSETTVGRAMIDSCRDKLSPEEALVVSEFLLAGEATRGLYYRELMRRCPHNGPFFDDDDCVVCEPCGKAFKSCAGRPVDDPSPDRLSSAEAFVVGEFLRSYCEGENEVGDELGEFGELMRRCPHVSYAKSIDGSLLYVCHVCGKVFQKYDDFDFSLIIFNGEFLPESLQKCSKCGRRSHEHGMYRKGERVAFLTGSECVP